MPTEDRKPTGNKKERKRGPRARVRVLRIFLVSFLIIVTAAGAAVYSSRGLLRYAAEERARILLAQSGNIDFHVAHKEFRLFPPRMELEGITVGAVGDGWALSAEEAVIELSPAAFFFRGAGVAKLRVIRPRYIQRAGRLPGIRPADGDVGEPGPATGPPFDMAELLGRKIPFRSVEIVDGEIAVAGRGGEGLEAAGVNLSAALSGGRLIARLRFDEGFAVREGTAWDLGRVRLDVVLDKGQATVRNLLVKAPLLEGEVSGTVGYDGTAALNVAASLPVAGVTERLGHGRPLDGRLLVKGKVTGNVRGPAFSGTAVLRDPEAGGYRWPDVTGVVSWKKRRFQWRNLKADVADGSLSSSGFVNLGAPVPRYGLSVTAEEFYPAALSPLVGTAAGAVRNMSGTLRWEGTGFNVETLTGTGSLTGLFGVEAFGWEPVDLEAEGSLAGGKLDIARVVLRSGNSVFRSRGSWDFDEGLRIYLEAVVGSLARYLKPLELEGIDGRLFAEGELTATGDGMLFEGPVRWENGSAFGLRPFGAAASVSFDGRTVALDNGRVGWRGSTIEVSGTMDLKEKQIDLLTSWKDLSLGAIAPLFGAQEEAEGLISIDGSLLGGWSEPILSGRFSAAGLRYGEITIGEAAGALTFAGGVLDLQTVSLTSGESTLTLEGRLVGDRISGSLESMHFDLRSFVPTSAADVIGGFQADLSGTVASPKASGNYIFFSLAYETWSFKEAGGTFDYRDGAFRLEGHLIEPVNRYRLRIEPHGDWPFTASVSLGRFSPELAQEGFLGLPGDVREALAELSFLAVGEFSASGKLKELRTIRAKLELETIWVYTEKQTLQNVDPLHVVWQDGTVTVDDFSVTGEDYRISLGGTGSLEEGWDLAVGGQVNLSLFQGYWAEVEYIDAPGNVELRLAGEWDSPELEGEFDFVDGTVLITGQYEPITRIAGAGELKGGIFTLHNFSGNMAENHFLARGSLDLETREIDAFVEGHIDLSVFRGRVPGTREMKGPVSARLTLRGSAGRPRINGEVILKGAELFHQAMPQRITGLSGKVLIEEEGLVIEELAGKMGTGDIALEGFVDWSQEPVRIDIGLAASRVVFVLEDIAKALLSADLSLSGDFDALRLSGDIEFHKARYFREFKDKIKRPPALMGGAGGGGKDRGGPELGGTVLDVNITAPDRFWIVNSTVELENSVAIHLGGTIDEPLLDGEIRLLRGEVTYFTRRFTLFAGRIFNVPPGINPVVEAQAEVVEGTTRIFLLLEGPLKKPTLQLTSLPPHSQEDLIALLTVGQTRSSLEEQKGESLAIGAAIVFGSPVIEQIGEGAREVSGIEFFQVQPAIAEETSTAKVTLGTQLSDRLFMSASQTIGLTEEQQLRLEYQLFDYVSILGQQLRQGIYTLDLVLQWDFD